MTEVSRYGSARISPEAIAEAKIAAAQAGITLKEWIELAIKEKRIRQNKQAKK